MTRNEVMARLEMDQSQPPSPPPSASPTHSLAHSYSHEAIFGSGGHKGRDGGLVGDITKTFLLLRGKSSKKREGRVSLRIFYISFFGSEK